MYWEFIVLAFGWIVLVTMAAILGVLSYLRMNRYRKALLEAEHRIRALEAGVPSPMLPPPNGAAARRAAPVSPPVSAQISQSEPEPAPQPMPEPAPDPAPPASPSRALTETGPPPPLPSAPDEPEALKAPRERWSFSRFMAAQWVTIVNWLFGIALALGVFGFVQRAGRDGFFDEAAYVSVGLALGLGMIWGADFLRRRPGPAAVSDWQTRHGPAILAVAGLICIYGVVLVGMAQLRIVSPSAGLSLLSLTALGGIGLSLAHDKPLAWLGLAFGFGAPLLVGPGAADWTAYFAFLFAVVAAAFALARQRGWTLLAGAATLASFGWSAFWATQGYQPGAASVASGFAVAVAALGVAYSGAELAGPAFARNAAGKARLTWRGGGWIGPLAIVASTASLLILCVASEPTPAPVYGLIALALLTALAATARQGFSPLAPLPAAAAIGALLLWTPAAGASQTYLIAALCFGAASMIGGWAMLSRAHAPVVGAVLAALAPVLTVWLARERLVEVGWPHGWAGAAGLIAILNAVALDRLADPGAAGRSHKPMGAITVFAGAAALGAALAGWFSFSLEHLGAFLALLTAPAAWLDRRLNLSALRATAVLFAAASLALLSPIVTFQLNLTSAPFDNSLAYSFGAALLGLGSSAAAYYSAAQPGIGSRTALILRAGTAVMIVFAGVSIIRHWATGGDMRAPYVSLLEQGAHVAFLMAVALLARAGSHPPMRLYVERATLAAAALATAAGGLAWLSPWWGLAPADVAARPLVNGLLAAYALPAALFALYAAYRTRGETPLRVAVIAFAVLLAGVWATLEIRRGFHPEGLSGAAILPAEHFCYTALILAAGAAALGAAIRWNIPHLRTAAAAVTAIAFAKALAIDIGLVEGLALRSALYALTAGAAAGIVLFYRRFVFGAAGANGAMPAADLQGRSAQP